MENNKDKKKKPLKLSSSSRMQIRKNLGPSVNRQKSDNNKKTIQIVFRNKNNQQKSSSTAKSNFRGSSSFRSPSPQVNSNFSQLNKNKSFEGDMVEVLVENKIKNQNKFFGRTECMTAVIFDGEENIEGQIVPVLITHSNQNNLFGEIKLNKDIKAA